MISFGIDPGSRAAGWGAVRLDASRLTCLGFGVIRVNEKAILAERLRIQFDALTERLHEYSPHQIVLESLFHHKNVKSALVLSHARGVALLAAARCGCRIEELSPAEIKKAVTGSGRAAKPQVQQMVKTLLGLAEIPPTDAADALAVAIAGSTRAKFAALVGEQPQGKRGTK